MIVEAVRLLITLVLTAGGYLLGVAVGEPLPGLEDTPDTAPVVGAVLGAGVGYVLGGVLGRAFRRRLAVVPDRLAPRSTGPELFAGAFGVIVGLLVGAVGSIPIVVFLPAAVAWPLSALVVLIFTSVGGSLFAARAQDLLALAGLKPRGPVFARRLDQASKSYLLDSSAAIDGGVLELTRSGLIDGRMWVPAFVVDELQGLADAGERSRRRRGRRGLDVLNALRGTPGSDLVVLEDSVPEHVDVDAKLIALADRSAAILVTTDHNLAKAAGVRGISVLNPQALADSLRPPVVSGDQLRVAIVKAGTEAGQGVGYLEDGTMVVVEDTATRVGEEIEVEVTGSTRTSVGRMVFARPAS